MIRDRLIADGGWIERPVACFNLYRPPTITAIRVRRSAGSI